MVLHGVALACPCAAAKCSGVVPSWHRTLGSARLGPSSVVSMSRAPAAEAKKSRGLPSCSDAACTSAPKRRQRATQWKSAAAS